MSAMTSQIMGVANVYSIVCSGANQRKHQSSASLAFMSGIHRWPVNYPHKGSVTGKIFPFDDAIMSRRLIPRYKKIFYKFRPDAFGCFLTQLIVAQWRHLASLTVSTSVQVMARCLVTPSHYQIMCLFIINEVMWHSHGDIARWNGPNSSPWNIFYRGLWVIDKWTIKVHISGLIMMV